MIASYATEVRDGYLKVTLTGKWKPDLFPEIAELVRADADQALRTCVLIDLRQMQAPPGKTGHRFLQHHARRIWHDRITVAVIQGPDLSLEDPHDGSMTDNKRLKISSTEQEALRWLESTHIDR